MNNTNSVGPSFDSLLRLIVHDELMNEVASIPPQADLERMYTVSTKHDARMRKLCAQTDRGCHVQSVFQAAKRVAVAAMIVLTVFAGTLMLNPQVRADVVETIVTWYNEFTQFTGLVSPSEEKSWEPTFIPEGYSEVGRVESELTMLRYEDAQGNLLVISIAPADNSVLIDNEDMTFSETVIEGILYSIFIAENADSPSHIEWEREGYQFSVSGYLSQNILQQTAESVQIKK